MTIKPFQSWHVAVLQEQAQTVYKRIDSDVNRSAPVDRHHGVVVCVTTCDVTTQTTQLSTDESSNMTSLHDVWRKRFTSRQRRAHVSSRYDAWYETGAYVTNDVHKSAEYHDEIIIFYVTHIYTLFHSYLPQRT